jgi:hypothetical protein
MGSGTRGEGELLQIIACNYQALPANNNPLSLFPQSQDPIRFLGGIVMSIYRITKQHVMLALLAFCIAFTGCTTMDYSALSEQRQQESLYTNEWWIGNGLSSTSNSLLNLWSLTDPTKPKVKTGTEYPYMQNLYRLPYPALIQDPVLKGIKDSLKKQREHFMRLMEQQLQEDKKRIQQEWLYKLQEMGKTKAEFW